MTKEKEHILWIIFAVVVIVAMLVIAWTTNLIKLPSGSVNTPSIQSAITEPVSPSESSVNDNQSEVLGQTEDGFVEFEEPPVILTEEDIARQNAEDFPELPDFPSNDVAIPELDAASLQAAPLN